jgi:hypothetical protein
VLWLTNLLSEFLLMIFCMTANKFGFTITYEISAYHHQSCKLNSTSWPGVLDTTFCEQVCHRLAVVLQVLPLIKNKHDRHNIIEIFCCTEAHWPQWSSETLEEHLWQVWQFYMLYFCKRSWIQGMSLTIRDQGNQPSWISKCSKKQQLKLLQNIKRNRGHCGYDHMVVQFTTT